MDTMEIARALVNLGLDMDYQDYSETTEDEIELISDDLSELKNKDKLLYRLLENIAEVSTATNLV